MKNPAIGTNWLHSLPEAQGDFKDLQINSRNYILDKGFPNKENEAWRLDYLNRLDKFISLPIINHTEEKADFSKELLPESNEKVCRIHLDSDINSIKQNSLPQGIRKLTNNEIMTIFNTHSQIEYNPKNWARLLNYAVTKDILGLSINGDNLPTLEVIVSSNPNKLNSSRLFIFMEEKSNLDFLVVIKGSNNCALNHLLEIKLDRKAVLNHGLLALGNSDQSNLLSNINVHQEDNSNYSLTSLHQGWHYSRHEPRVIQIKGNAMTSMKGLQVTTKKEQISTHSLVKFNGPSGFLNQLQKAVATQSSHAIFNGAIQVPQIAQKTEASQLSRNLLLSKRARIDTKPELEIIADDVRCTHGATVSQLQEEEFFYLRSRGINNDHANSLLLKGYYDEIVSALPVGAERWNFLDKLISSAQK